MVKKKTKRLEEMTNYEYEKILIDQITQLENDLYELQQDYNHLLYMYQTLVDEIKKGQK